MQKYSHLVKCCLMLLGILAPIARAVTVSRSFKKVSIAKSRQITQESLVTSEAACLVRMRNRTEQSLTEYHAATYERETKECQLIGLNMTVTPGDEAVHLMVPKDSEGLFSLLCVSCYICIASMSLQAR